MWNSGEEGETGKKREGVITSSFVRSGSSNPKLFCQRQVCILFLCNPRTCGILTTLLVRPEPSLLCRATLLVRTGLPLFLRVIVVLRPPPSPLTEDWRQWSFNMLCPLFSQCARSSWIQSISFMLPIDFRLLALFFSFHSLLQYSFHYCFMPLDLTKII